VSTTVLDRLLRPVKPRAITTFAPPHRELDSGVWRLERKLKMPGGLVLPVGMTIFRLPSGGLLLHSPIALDESVARAIAQLGPVSVVLAPNSFHHLFVADYLERFPGARLFTAPGLSERAGGLPPAAAVGPQCPVEWEGAVEPIVFGPIGSFAEVVVHHPASATLVLTDLAFNMVRYENAFDRIGWRLFGVPPRFGVSRTARFTLLRDGAAARPFLRAIAERSFRRILVAHGDPVESDARAEFERAFRRYL
jgi:Domain of unknown function (DUF4336)